MYLTFYHAKQRYFLATALAGFLSACSVHPLPDDVGSVPTTDIVRSIRCETLAGIDSLPPEDWARAEPIVRATFIGYYFFFGIQEENGLSGAGGKESNFLTLANGSKFKADVRGSAKLERESERKFLIIEPLADMLSPANRDTCTNRSSQRNWTYPIAGRIGLDEVTRTYLRLEMLSEIGKSRAKPKDFPDSLGTKQIVFSDDLIFTTNFDAGATHTLAVDAVVGKLRVINSSIKANAFRHDTHRVVVALTRNTIDIDEAVLPRAGSRRFVARAERLKFVSRDNVRDPRTQALLIQIDKEARTRIAIELHRRRSLNDPDHLPAQALGQRLIDVLKLP